MSGGSASPGEILVAFDAAALALRECPGSATAVVYAVLRAVGVPRVDSRGMVFGIDLDTRAAQGGRTRAEILDVERRWHAGDLPGDGSTPVVPAALPGPEQVARERWASWRNLRTEGASE